MSVGSDRSISISVVRPNLWAPVEDQPSLAAGNARDEVLGALQHPEPFALCQRIDHRWSSPSLLRILPLPLTSRSGAGTSPSCPPSRRSEAPDCGPRPTQVSDLRLPREPRPPSLTAIVEGKPVRDTDSTADRCDREAVPSRRFPSPREGPFFHDEEPWHSFPWPGFFVMGSLDVPTV
jgi:hypothetical protein